MSLICFIFFIKVFIKMDIELLDDLKNVEIQEGYTLKYIQSYELINIISTAIKYLSKTTNTKYNVMYGIHNPITLAVQMFIDGKFDNTLIERNISKERTELLRVSDLKIDQHQLETYWNQVNSIEDI